MGTPGAAAVGMPDVKTLGEAANGICGCAREMRIVGTASRRTGHEGNGAFETLNQNKVHRILRIERP